MHLQYTFSKRYHCFWVAFVIWSVGAGVEGGGVKVPGRQMEFREIRTLEGFAALAEKEGVVPVFISPCHDGGDHDRAQTQEKMEWGQRMLGELERMRLGENESPNNAEDALAFREWCLEAAGGGNLLLSTASEEAVVSLLFRELVAGGESSGAIHRLLERCTRDGATAGYWLATLTREGRDTAKLAGIEDKDADYLRLASLFNAIWTEGGNNGSCPATPSNDGNWSDRMDNFCPFQLMARRVLLAKKEVVLEACLAIQKATGAIPLERDAFLVAVERHADDILRFRGRLTGRIPSLEVWTLWNQEYLFWNPRLHE